MIGSNASSDTVTAGLAATGLDALFDTVITWNEVAAGRGKPAHDIRPLTDHDRPSVARDTVLDMLTATSMFRVGIGSPADFATSVAAAGRLIEAMQR